MKDIYQLKDEFDKIGKSDYLAMIKFYESNIVYINNIDIEIDSHHYDAKLRLQSEYGLCLVNAGYYSPAISILESSIKMFENSPTLNSDKLYTNTYFELLLWNYGIALWKQKKYQKPLYCLKDWYSTFQKMKNIELG
jgi:tetratricopeptide (TPR) repeat protein